MVFQVAGDAYIIVKEVPIQDDFLVAFHNEIIKCRQKLTILIVIKNCVLQSKTFNIGDTIFYFKS